MDAGAGALGSSCPTALLAAHGDQRKPPADLLPVLLPLRCPQLATAGVQPCGSWLSGYYSALERQLDVFGGPDLANLLWGLAKFDLRPEVRQRT